MSEPELWTQCPRRDDLKRRNCPVCDGYPDHGLVRVPFDQAVERMADYLRRYDDDEQAEGFYRGRAADLLRAALGEEP